MPTVIEMIKNAEEKAVSIRREASADARNIINEAPLDYQQTLDKTTEECRALLVSQREQAEFDGEKKAREVIEEYKEKAEKLCADARINLDSAATYILERLTDI